MNPRGATLERPAGDIPIAEIAYGETRLPLAMDPRLADWFVIRPEYEAPLADPHAAFAEACRRPIGSPRLGDVIKPGERVVVVTSDGTRPVPNRQLIPWLLEELPGSDEDLSILLGNGTHRANTPEEIEAMFGEEIAGRIAIHNHDAFDADSNRKIATTRSGSAVLVDRRYLEADRRIVLGFIEPHFFAGFSGGAKGVVPGVAGIDSILPLHDFEMIAHPKSAYGIMEGNPIQAEIAEMVAHCPPDFMINVTLNTRKEITAVFAGDYREAHRIGCASVKRTAMVPVDREFPIVVTSSGGYPLDQNLYQTVKGMSAAEGIVQKGGTIFVAGECRDGIPSHGNFGSLLDGAASAEDLMSEIRGRDCPVLDQWQVQILARILMRSEIALFSALDEEASGIRGLTQIADLQSSIEERIRAAGNRPSVAVLPDGPLTIPYVRN